jgi:hypothetical protein
LIFHTFSLAGKREPCVTGYSVNAIKYGPFLPDSQTPNRPIKNFGRDEASRTRIVPVLTPLTR